MITARRNDHQKSPAWTNSVEASTRAKSLFTLPLYTYYSTSRLRRECFENQKRIEIRLAVLGEFLLKFEVVGGDDDDLSNQFLQFGSISSPSCKGAKSRSNQVLDNMFPKTIARSHIYARR